MSDWSNWKWQLRNRITTIEELQQYIELTDEERAAIAAASREFIWSVTPYYASLMDRTDRRCPVRMQAVPTAEELFDEAGVADPLAEEQNSPVERIIHVYPDRVAFVVGNRCAVYCRHCLRKETMVGKPDREYSEEKIAEGIDYIRAHPEIRDVLLTGGDPLMMADDRVESILSRIRAIPSVEVVRIGSRTPCTLPQRITPELCRMLAKYHPLYLNTQFNHPKEITPQAEEACARLTSAGIPLGNQSVLMAGINDDLETMRTLCTELMRIRVRPYYIYQCQTLTGTKHFRTPIEQGIELMTGLQGHISGLAVPKYLLDTPYGKIPISPSYVVGREGDEVVLRSYDGKTWREFNPLHNQGRGKCGRPIVLDAGRRCEDLCRPCAGCADGS
jgi:lysine 2,3-aminomutase